MSDIYSSAILKRAISPVVATDNTELTTQIIDTKSFGSVLFGILTGTLADADATFAVTVAESNAANMDGSNAVSADNIVGTIAGAGFQYDDDNEVRKLLVRPTKRYVQLTITPSANSGNAPIAAFALLIEGKYLPVTQPQA